MDMHPHGPGALSDSSFSFFRLSPLIMVMGLIFTLSHQPGDSLNISLAHNTDKLCHAAIYALLAAACVYAFLPLRPKVSDGRLQLAVVLFCIAYGISDEWHQSFIPFRSPSFSDVIADGFGAVITVFAWRRWWRRR